MAWTSSDTTIVTVDAANRITGRAVGSTTLILDTRLILDTQSLLGPRTSVPIAVVPAR